MAEDASGLILRAHDRRACDLGGEVRVSPRDARRVVLSGAATGPEGAVDCRVVDFSEGGVGLHCRVFLPIGCELVVRVDGGAESGALSIRGVVRRAQMVGRGPEYYLGLAFSDRDAQISRGLAELVQIVGDGADPSPEAGRA
jgi:hypothetical protein